MSPSIRYSITTIRTQTRNLIQQGKLHHRQPIYTLCQYIPASQWVDVERELEDNDFLLRDRLGDLVPQEEWEND